MHSQNEPALIERLVEEHHADWVAKDGVKAWSAGHAHAVLLLAGDPVRFPEGQDVAVVLPELVKSCAANVRLGVVRRRDEDALGKQLGSQRWPSLLFFKDGQYATVLSGMHDWDAFPRLFHEALEHAASRLPTIGVPVVSASAGSGACST